MIWTYVISKLRLRTPLQFQGQVNKQVMLNSNFIVAFLYLRLYTALKVISSNAVYNIYDPLSWKSVSVLLIRQEILNLWVLAGLH